MAIEFYTRGKSRITLAPSIIQLLAGTVLEIFVKREDWLEYSMREFFIFIFFISIYVHLGVQNPM